MTPTKRPVKPDETVHHISARKKRRGSGGGIMSVNMTPMIDVTFLLLIFFVVATNFARQEGAIASRLPDVKDNLPPPTTIEIQIGETSPEEPWVKVNGSLVAMEDVSAELRGMAGSTAFNTETTVVRLKPEGNVAYAHVLRTYNSVIVAEFKKINWAQEL